MKEVTKQLTKLAKMFSMDCENQQSIETLYYVLVNENKKHHNSVIIPAVKAISPKAYAKLVDFVKCEGNLEDLYWLDLYRNAPEEPAISVEVFTAEDLLYIK